MTTARDQIARSAADLLEAADELPPAVVGFDGFIDSILDVVDVRYDMSPGGYEPIRTIDQFAKRIAAASGRSMNLEIVEREERWGGNGPLLAGAMGRLGSPVTYIGAVGGGGAPPDPNTLHPSYEEFASRCQRVVPLCPPARTRALEFTDGKVMLNEPQNVQQVTLDRVLAAVGGEEALAECLRPAAILGVVNWSLVGGVEGILRGLLDRILPRLSRAARGPGALRVFIDLTDPAKRTDDDLRGMLALLAEINRVAPVTLGVNIAEAERLACVAGANAPGLRSISSLGPEAANLRTALKLDCLIIHTRHGAGAATAAGDEHASFEGPFVTSPAITTGAGDHFNGGFALAQSAGMPLPECLAMGCAVGGFYVRSAAAPDQKGLIEFLRALPQPEVIGE